MARPTQSEMSGGYNLAGSYRLACSTGAVTTVAAATSTAGHLFAFRWAPATLTTYNCYVRRIMAKFILTTAYGAAQETGCDLIVARSYSASHSGGTAVDTGSTVANTGKFRTAEGTSLMAVAGLVNVATTTGLTAGTQTLDANPIASLSDWSGAVGNTVPLATSGALSGYGVLLDASANNFPLVLANNEGFIIRNKILMGATGVGRWDFAVEWDEGVPNGQQLA